jgi:hypothetical protein
VRGTTPLELPVPTNGLIANLPPHKVPPNSCLSGSLNQLYFPDGLFHVRMGHQTIGSPQPTERTIGGCSYQDGIGGTQIVLGGETAWWAYVGGAWTNLAGGHPLTNTADNAARFAVYWAGILNPSTPAGFNVLGVNDGISGSCLDRMHYWRPGMAAFALVKDPNWVNGVPGASDICVLNNRVVIANITDGSNRFPQTVMWSQVNSFYQDPAQPVSASVWPALAQNTLPSDLGNIISCTPTGRLNAVLYCERGAWFMASSPGTDATAFAFERLTGVALGPVSPSAVCQVGNSHYYIGQDARIYYFDGQSATPISDAIDSLLIGQANVRQLFRSHAVYKPQFQQVWFYMSLNQATDPTDAVVYDLKLGRFMPFQNFGTIGISCSVPVRDVQGASWDGSGGQPEWGLTGTALPNPFHWTNIPYSRWDQIPDISSLSTYVGSVLSNPTAYPVFRADSGNTDNGVAITYALFFPVRESGKPMYQIQVDSYTLDMPPQAMAGELLVVIVYGLVQPFTPITAATILDIFSFPTTNAQFRRLLSNIQPPVPNPSFIRPGSTLPNNYVQMGFNGVSRLGGVPFGGGNMFVFETLKKDTQ